jgi:hypothetical protein
MSFATFQGKKNEHLTLAESIYSVVQSPTPRYYLHNRMQVEGTHATKILTLLLVILTKPFLLFGQPNQPEINLTTHFPRTLPAPPIATLPHHLAAPEFIY